MTFAEQLNRYLDELNCTSRELAEKSGISASTLSRYRNGKRLPGTEGKTIAQLADVLAALAEEKGSGSAEYARPEILQTLQEAAKESHDRFDYEGLSSRINQLTAELPIHMADLARASHYDLSGFSRICRGKRRPNHPQLLAQDIAGYIASNFMVNGEYRRVMQIIGEPEETIRDTGEYRQRIYSWLLGGQEENLPLQEFLRKMETFDMEDYLREVNFDSVWESEEGFRLPVTCEYRGLDGMREGEMDFFRCTAQTKSYRDVILYSDFPMEGCTTDSEIIRRWMCLVANVLKKGIHINLIHDVSKPFDQIEHVMCKWMPLYMIGQISPWYLPDPPDSYFHHMLMVSGNTSYTGEAVAGHHTEGKYVLSTQKDVVEYTEERAALLMEKAQPLMEIYRSGQSEEFREFLKKDGRRKGVRRSALSAPPIYTISPGLLKKILQYNEVDEKQSEEILAWAEKERRRFLSVLKHGTVNDRITVLNRQELERFPVSLSLAGLFLEKNIFYRYEDYREHLRETRDLAKELPGYTAERDREAAFRNIQMRSHEGKWVMISKNRSPAIHYIVYQERLRKAFENLFLGGPTSEIPPG